MHPAQLAQLMCALAAARNAHHVMLLSLAEPPSATEVLEARRFALHLSRSCALSNYLRQPLDAADVFGNSSDRKSLFTEEPWRHQDTLFVSLVSADQHFESLNKVFMGLGVARRPWVVVCHQDLMREVVAGLSWPLDNKIILLTHNSSSLSMMDVYRPAPALGAVVQRLGVVPVPAPTQHWAAETAPLLGVVARDPWYRRTNLTGLVLRCSVLPYVPFSNVTEKDGALLVTGVMGDVWDTLRQTLGFSGVCHQPADRKWGSVPTPEGEWEGILGELKRGEADVGLPFYGNTRDRFEIVEFAYPFGQKWSVVVMQKFRLADDGSSYTRVFNKYCWGTVALFWVVCMMVMPVFTAVSPHETNRTLGYSVITNIRIFCNMGFEEETPRSVPYRTWLLSALLLVAVLHVCYSAFLITMLTDSGGKLPLQDLTELHRKREDYTFGTEKDTFQETVLKMAQGSPWKELYQDIVKEHPEYLESAKDGLARVEEDNRHAFMTEAWRYYAVNFNCKHNLLPDKYLKVEMGMPLRRHGPANPILNYVLSKMHGSGLFRRFFRKWKANGQRPPCVAYPYSVLGLGQTLPAFQLLAMGFGLSLVFLTVEFFSKKMFDRN